MEEKKPEVGAPTEAERAASGAEKSSNAPHTDGAPDQPSSGLIAASESDWPFPPAHLDLADQEIHVWRAWLDELAPDLPSFTETLSASERNRAARFQFERDRNRFILRRGLLRRILGRYLNLDPAQLSFTYEARGKPSLAGTVDAPTIHFNLSHSEGLALFAVTRSAPFGIDLERVRPMPEPDQIAAKFFSARENVILSALPAEQRLEGFFNCWTRKEAYLKATGQGIADALPEVEVSLTPGQPAQLLSVAGDAQEASLWSFHALAPAPGFVGALAVKAMGLKLVCWQWAGSRPASPAGR